MKYKLIQKILLGNNDANIRFSELQKLLSDLNFKHRIKGDHYIYYRDDIAEIINIQPNNNMAKPYQVKQVKKLIIKYNLGGVLNE